MNVGEIMVTEVVTIAPDNSLATAWKLVNEGGFHHLPVVEHGRLVGVLSDRDLLRATSPFVGQLSERTLDLKTLERRVHQLMTRRLVTATATESLDVAATRMIQAHISCLMVVEGARLLGIVTWRDFLRAFVPPTVDAPKAGAAKADAAKADPTKVGARPVIAPR